MTLALSASYDIPLLNVILIQSLTSSVIDSYHFALALQSLVLCNLYIVQYAGLAESNHLSSRGLGFHARKHTLLADKYSRLDYGTHSINRRFDFFFLNSSE